MHKPVPNTPLAPHCPRCGYDQSGEVARWEPAGMCPLTGRCSECGLEFEWPDVIDPARKRLPWLFEHARGLGLVTAWRTWAHAILPNRLWKNLGLEHQIRVARLWLWIPALLAPFYVVGAGLRLATLWSIRQRFGGAGVYAWNEWVNCLLDPLFAIWHDKVSGWTVHFLRSQRPYPLVGPLAIVLLMPLTLLLLGQSRAVSKVRAAQVFRAGVYQLAVFTPLAWWKLWADITLLLESGMWGQPLTNLYHVATRISFENAPLVALFLLAWLAWYWYVVITRGLRLPLGRLVWVLLMTAGLLGATLASLADDRFRQLLFH